MFLGVYEMTPGRRKICEHLISVMVFNKIYACMTRPRGRMPISVYRFLSEYHYLRTRKLNKRKYTATTFWGVLHLPRTRLLGIFRIGMLFTKGSVLCKRVTRYFRRWCYLCWCWAKRETQPDRLFRKFESEVCALRYTGL